MARGLGGNDSPKRAPGSVNELWLRWRRRCAVLFATVAVTVTTAVIAVTVTVTTVVIAVAIVMGRRSNVTWRIG